VGGLKVFDEAVFVVVPFNLESRSVWGKCFKTFYCSKF
jgi:hypothetical protein